MALLSQASLDSLQQVYDSSLVDSCSIIRTVTTGLDEYNRPVTTTTTQTGVPCRFFDRSSDELAGTAEVPEFDAEIDLPLATLIVDKDLVRLMKLSGLAVVSILFEVVGASKTRWGVRVKVKKQG